MDDAEALAREKGRKYVMDVLKRPEQLEKVAKYQRQVALKKASVDAFVKTALQSQLDGVRKGLELLRTAQSDVEKVKTGLEGFETHFQNLPKLDEIKEENRRHSQFVTAKDNLKNIFSVPEYVTKTKDWISEGKLLFAAKSLAELENSRDDLMFELHKQSADSKSDMALLSMYFEEVSGLSTLMEKQIRLVLARTLNTVRKDPTVIVTALRVVEQEEARDAAALIRQKQSGFICPNRPKQWKAMAMEVLKSNIESRIEGTQTDEREDNKMWLVRHLEMTRQLLNEDLRVVRTLCAPCFPPSWRIVESFTSMYRSCLQAHIEDLVAQNPEGNELVTLLGWVLNTYPELGLPVPLLPGPVVHTLQQKYLAHIKQNLSAWMDRTLAKEKEDWVRFIPPEQDNGVFISPAPAIIGQMVEQNLSVARTVSPELTTQVMQLCASQIARYADLYAMAVKKLRDQHFLDRSKNAVYTQQMIAVLNNCVALHEAAAAWSRDGRQHSGLLKVRDEAIHYLLQEPFSDLKPQFDGLFSQPWFQGPSASSYTDTIYATFEDYFGDYSLLLPENLSCVLIVAQSKVAKAYIYKIIQGDIKLESYEERKAATGKIRSEIGRIQKLFKQIDVSEDPGFALVEPLTEIIRAEDPEMLLLDLHRLIEVFPEMTDAQLTSLLLTRGDIPKTEIREKVASALSAHQEVKDTLLTKGMFSLRGKGMLNLDWDHYWTCLINPP